MDFSVALHATECVLTFFIIGSVGFLAAKTGMFSTESQIAMAKLITLVALPVYLFHNIITTFTKDALLHLVYGSLLPLCSVALTLLLSFAATRLLRIPPARAGIFRVGFSFSNTIYIGIPVNMTLFGAEAVPYALLYYFASTVLFWTLGNHSVASCGKGANVKLLSLTSLKNIFSPPLFGFLLGILALMVQVNVPLFVDNAMKYMGNLTTPLVMLSIGATMRGMGLAGIKPNKELAALFLGRYVVCPLLLYGLTCFFPLPELMRRVFLIQASLPTISSLGMLASYHGGDVDYATRIVTSTTLFTLVSVPLFMVLVTRFA